MAANKRDCIKWVRDKAKAAYKKAACCYICGSTDSLDLHHYNGLTVLFEQWAKSRGYDISTDDGVVAVRDEFIEQHHSELYIEVATLCKVHHKRLHQIYGTKPSPTTAKKQAAWVELQKEKYGNKKLDS